MFDFDLANYDTDDFERVEALPAGRYNAYIESAEIKMGANAGVSYLAVVLSILRDNQRYRVYDRMLVTHHKIEAQNIGRKKIAKLAKAINKTNAVSSADFVNCSCIVNLAIEDKTHLGYGFQNKVRWYEELENRAF